MYLAETNLGDYFAMQIFPKIATNLWQEWNIRAMVSLSLFLQVILITFGNRRKNTTRNWVRIVLWLSYISADSVATVSLGILSNNDWNLATTGTKSTITITITSLWAPLLLLHLGGPDVITAYALEDNELWLRHLMGLGIQVGAATYVCLSAWTGTSLNFVMIPIFLVGMMKYAERTWALRSSSRDHFGESLLPSPNPGINYPVYVEEYRNRRDNGMDSSAHERIELQNVYTADRDLVLDARIYYNAYYLFMMFRRLYADLVLSFQDRKDSISILKDMSPSDAFKLIEIELGFMYDVLYTKATLLNSYAGIGLRVVSVSLTLCFFVAFHAVVKHHKMNISVGFSYVFLGVAIVLEIYALFQNLSSDWTMLWFFPKEKSMMWLPKQIRISLYQRISSFRSFKRKQKRWSHSMAQFSLLSYCLKNRAKSSSIVMNTMRKYFDSWEKEWFKGSNEVTEPLQEIIFNRIRQRSILYSDDLKACRTFCSHRGDLVLKERHCLGELGWSIQEMEFDQSILLWHIATDLCYYSPEIGKEKKGFRNSEWVTISKQLADYMMYLLVIRPYMLPKGIGKIRFQDTCAEVTRFIRDRPKLEKNEMCKLLLEVETEEIPPHEVKGDKCKSVLFEGCRLTRSLEMLVTDKKMTDEGKWEIIGLVWIEMLFYAGTRCGWTYHAQQLRRGGEVLTHVCLLLAHLGLSEHFQTLQGGSRTYYQTTQTTVSIQNP